MNTLASIVTTGEIFAIFGLCLCTSFGLAYLFLRTVVNLTRTRNFRCCRGWGNWICAGISSPSYLNV